ncbi:protein-disulfide reductase DsbD family protein [Marinagarivorans algicola]|uniref:protein-disulfide reductase DsbD family protein n=1 Tax=Marinagarivorans algicola TaxID=1513270 RepID=UPI0006B60AC1|nr:protein-disulfide reductase DsbD [Marinagarivorans algicola]
MKLITFVTLWLVLAASAFNAWAADPFAAASGDEFLPVEQAYQADLTLKGDKLHIDWAIAPGYYLYKKEFKLDYLTPTDKTRLNPTLEKGKMKFDPYFNKDLETYYNTTRIVLDISGYDNQFELKMKSQGCADAGLCYAPRSQYFQIDKTTGQITQTKKQQTTLTQEGQTSEASSQAALIPEEAPKSLLVYILLAMGGGILLNLMPCVFPVLSLKALSFASHSEDKHSHQAHGWAYTAGIIGSFIVVALAILALRSAGTAAGWGFQLQSPLFVAAVMYLFLVMGLSLSGMIYFGTGLMGVGQNLTQGGGLKGSFFTGVLAAVVASPCTGPMMAPALGFALTQPAYIAISIFIALGFGLALPFLALSYSPALARKLPAPGTWMEVLKQFLAFPMYITAAWLLYVFGNQVGMTGAFFLMLGAIAIVYAIWVFQHIPEKGVGKWLVQWSGYGALVLAGYIAYNGETFKKDDSWINYTPTVIAELREGGQPVFVDFTADWCITCKVNEQIALDREEFREVVARYDYAKVKGDWTNQDEDITNILTEYKRSGVPLYLVFPADPSKPAEVLPQILTKNLVIEALERNAAL